MAIKYVRKKHKNADGSYDVIHYETQAKVVWMPDGRSVEEAIPTQLSDLENDTGYLSSIPENYVTTKMLDDKGYLESIPGNYVTTEMLDDKGYLDSIPDVYVTTEMLDDRGYLDSIPDNYVTNEMLESKGYLDSIPDNYVTEETLNDYVTDEELENKGYLTEHQSLDGKQDKLTGSSDQLVGFDQNGEAIAVNKPTYDAADVGADVSGTAEILIGEHNKENSGAHADIRQDIVETEQKIIDYIDDEIEKLVDNASEFDTLGKIETALNEEKNRASKVEENLTDRLETVEVFFNSAAQSDEVIDTLKEIQEYIVSDASGAVEMLNKIGANTDNVSKLQSSKQDQLSGATTQYVGFGEDGNAIAVDMPSIPKKVSDIENDLEFITSNDIPTKISAFENDEKFVTESEHNKKQDTISGNEGQIVGFDQDGHAVAIDMPPQAENTISVSFVLYASNWIDGSQTVEIDGLTPSKDGFVYLSTSATDAQSEAIAEADVDIAQIDNGLVFTCNGMVPRIDIPCYIIMGAVAGSDIFTEAAKQEITESVISELLLSDMLESLGAQTKITGNAGQFVVIGDDGNVTTQTLTNVAEEGA